MRWKIGSALWGRRSNHRYAAVICSIFLRRNQQGKRYHEKAIRFYESTGVEIQIYQLAQLASNNSKSPIRTSMCAAGDEFNEKKNKNRKFRGRIRI